MDIEIEAKYPGVCACCGTAFTAGEKITQTTEFGGLGWALKSHVESPPVEAEPDICPKCFMAKSLNGTCMCEE